MGRTILAIVQLSLLAVVQAASSSSFHLPPPTGPLKVGFAPSIVLTDTSRNDIFAPPNTKRRIVVSVYYPTAGSGSGSGSGYGHNPDDQSTTTPYFSAAIAAELEKTVFIPANITTRIKLPILTNAPPLLLGKSCNSISTILFSPGFTANRLVYSALLTDLASHGYTVVAIDHPYDAFAVEIDESTIIYANINATNLKAADFGRFLAQRTADTLFAASKLYTLPGFNKCQPSRIGVFGHSLGGATAAHAIANDTTNSLVGGINMDGGFFSSVGPFTYPFFIMGAGSHNSSSTGALADPTWPEFKKTHGHGKGEWVRELNLPEAGHMTYSDFAGVIDMGGLRDLLPKETVKGYLGTMDGTRAIEVQRTYIKAFWEWVLKGKKEGNKKFVEGPSEKFPEVAFIN